MKDILPTGVLIEVSRYRGDVHAVRVFLWKEQSLSQVIDNPVRNPRKLFIKQLIELKAASSPPANQTTSSSEFCAPQIEKAALTLVLIECTSVGR